MAHRVEITNRAAQALVRIERGDRSAARRITKSIGELAEDPRPPGAVKLTGLNAWRIRIGVYRVVYEIDDGVRVVEVVRVAHRRDVYER